MGLDRFVPILALGLCSGPEIKPDPSLRKALEKIHQEASGPHCGFTASALEEARFVQTPDGIRIQMGSRVFTILAWNGSESVILRSVPTTEHPDKMCLEVDGIPENDVGWYGCSRM